MNQIKLINWLAETFDTTDPIVCGDGKILYFRFHEVDFRNKKEIDIVNDLGGDFDDDGTLYYIME